MLPDTIPGTPEVPQAAAPVPLVAAPTPISDTPPEVPAAAAPAAATAEQVLPPPVPPVVPAPTPTVSPEMQQHMAELEERVQRAEAVEDQQVMQDWTSNLATRLENEQGFTPEQAKFVAEREGQQAYRAYRAGQFQKSQLRAAVVIAKQYGVDAEQLMDLPTPAAMVQAAAQIKAQGSAVSELARLKAENEALKKKFVPTQNFASPGVSATPAPGSYIEKLKSGGPLPSAAEIDKFTARYLTGSA